MKKSFVEMPGINIQAPWSQMILSGKKTVETRSYPLPKKYENVPLAIIETPGPQKIVEKSRIVGIVQFSKSFQYKSRKDWLNDQHRHGVTPNDRQFSFNPMQPKFGWEISHFTIFEETVSPPKRRGIVFATKCLVWR